MRALEQLGLRLQQGRSLGSWRYALGLALELPAVIYRNDRRIGPSRWGALRDTAWALLQLPPLERFDLTRRLRLLAPRWTRLSPAELDDHRLRLAAGAYLAGRFSYADLVRFYETVEAFPSRPRR